MKTGLLLDESYADHHPGDHHPEAPGRIRAIIRELEERDLPDRCEKIERRAVTDDATELTMNRIRKNAQTIWFAQIGIPHTHWQTLRS